jgi:hypothetical protein
VRYWPALLRRNAERLASVPPHEAQALVRDSLLLADAGLLSMAEALAVAEGAMRHASPNVALTGIKLLEGLRDEWLGAADAREKARIVAERVVPRARELGWSRKAGDSDDLHAMRAALLRYAADRAEGASLRAEALALALRWLDDPRKVDATMAPSIHETAGRFADEATFAKLQDAAVAAENPGERSQLLGALMRARDPALRDRALALSLAAPAGKPALDGRSVFTLLEKALRDDESRPAAFDYLRRNLDALESRLPKDTPATLLIPLSRLCTAPERAALASTFGPRAQRYMAGPLRYAQALESIDLCLDARR